MAGAGEAGMEHPYLQPAQVGEDQLNAVLPMRRASCGNVSHLIWVQSHERIPGCDL